MQYIDQVLLHEWICNIFWICTVMHFTIGLPFGPLPWGDMIWFVVETVCTSKVGVFTGVCVSDGILNQLCGMILKFVVETVFAVVLTSVALVCMYWFYALMMVCFLVTMHIISTKLLLCIGWEATTRNTTRTMFSLTSFIVIMWKACGILTYIECSGIST